MARAKYLFDHYLVNGAVQNKRKLEFTAEVDLDVLAVYRKVKRLGKSSYYQAYTEPEFIYLNPLEQVT